jgi:hypothetical protein
MDLMEYQGKNLFRRYDIPTSPQGEIATTAGRPSHDQSWSCMASQKFCSIGLASTNPTSAGARGQPPCFIDQPKKPSRRSTNRSPIWLVAW